MAKTLDKRCQALASLPATDLVSNGWILAASCSGVVRVLSYQASAPALKASAISRSLTAMLLNTTTRSDCVRISSRSAVRTSPPVMPGSVQSTTTRRRVGDRLPYTYVGGSKRLVDEILRDVDWNRCRPSSRTASPP